MKRQISCTKRCKGGASSLMFYGALGLIYCVIGLGKEVKQSRVKENLARIGFQLRYLAYMPLGDKKN